jgi:NADH-quinone oxidoreductase subunit C
MTSTFSGKDLAAQIEEKFPGGVVESGPNHLMVKSEALLDTLRFLKETAGLDFDYLNHLTAVDYYQYFEVVYQLSSLEHNHAAVVKTRCHDRENPSLPSAIGIWQAADFQEREIYDLMGISFTGHPNMKRIFLWEDFQGHPLRKDYL